MRPEYQSVVGLCTAFECSDELCEIKRMSIVRRLDVERFDVGGRHALRIQDGPVRGQGENEDAYDGPDLGTHVGMADSPPYTSFIFRIGATIVESSV